MGWMSKDDKLQVFDRGVNGGLLLATAALVSVVYFVAFRPIDAQLQAAQQESSELEALVERTPDITKRNRDLQERLAACRKQTSELWQRIPSSPRESDFLGQVCQLAERTGMHVADYHPGGIDQRENHHELEVKIATRGEYKALCRFLEQVDQIPRLSRMTHLEIVGQTGESLTVELTYRIYFSPTPAAPTANKG